MTSQTELGQETKNRQQNYRVQLITEEIQSELLKDNISSEITKFTRGV